MSLNEKRSATSVIAMRKALLLILLLTGASGLRADEPTRALQQELKKQGYYFGEITGEKDVATEAAIKRFQIRNGLEATGSLNDETRKALGGSNEAAAKREEPPSSSKSVEEAPTPARSPADSSNERNSQSQSKSPQPLRGIWVENEGPYGFVFKNTPYESAPPEVQHQTVVRAEKILREEGFYEGIADGFPNEEFQLALVRYQQAMNLPRTGQCDMPTLGSLGLLPQAQRSPGQVYRGVWVR